MKQRPHLQSVAEISRHSVLSGDRIRQCETSSGSRHKDKSTHRLEQLLTEPIASVNSHVSLEAGGLCKLKLAKLTGQLLSCTGVGTSMSFHRTSGFKSHSARITTIRLFSSMTTHMTRQLIRTPKLPSTHITTVRLLAGVDTSMIAQRAFSFKFQRTGVAAEWTFARVTALVYN